MKATFAVCVGVWVALCNPSYGQPPQGGRGGSPTIGQAIQFDLEGKGAQARELFQKAIDEAATPTAKANAERGMAMSWAFEGNCVKTGEYEQKAIDYWVTQEAANPGNAFYQEGEIADEAGRVCIDAGDLDGAARWYKEGREMGLKEPGISADRKALWSFRYEHAAARLAARRGDRTAAAKHVEAARAELDKMTELRGQQEGFLPYLTGYVALYLGDYKAALADLEKANQKDAYIQCLMGQAYEKLGDKDKAMEYYRKAATVRGHNPPAAYVRWFTGKKLG